MAEEKRLILNELGAFFCFCCKKVQIFKNAKGSFYLNLSTIYQQVQPERVKWGQNGGLEAFFKVLYARNYHILFPAILTDHVSGKSRNGKPHVLRVSLNQHTQMTPESAGRANCCGIAFDIVAHMAKLGPEIALAQYAAYPSAKAASNVTVNLHSIYKITPLLFSKRGGLFLISPFLISSRWPF